MGVLTLLHAIIFTIYLELPILLALDCTSTCLDGKAECIPAQPTQLDSSGSVFSGKFVYGRPWYMYKYYALAETYNKRCSKIVKCPSVKKCKEVSKHPCGCCKQCSKKEDEPCGTHIGKCEFVFDCAPMNGLESSHPQFGICKLPPLPPDEIPPDVTEPSVQEKTTPSKTRQTFTNQNLSRVTIKPTSRTTRSPTTTPRPKTTRPPRPRRRPTGWGRRITRSPLSVPVQLIIGATGNLGPAG